MPVEHFVGNGAGFRYFCLWLPSFLIALLSVLGSGGSHVRPPCSSPSVLGSMAGRPLGRGQKRSIQQGSLTPPPAVATVGRDQADRQVWGQPAFMQMEKAV